MAHSKHHHPRHYPSTSARVPHRPPPAKHLHFPRPDQDTSIDLNVSLHDLLHLPSVPWRPLPTQRQTDCIAETCIAEISQDDLTRLGPLPFQSKNLVLDNTVAFSLVDGSNPLTLETPSRRRFVIVSGPSYSTYTHTKSHWYSATLDQAFVVATGSLPSCTAYAPYDSHGTHGDAFVPHYSTSKTCLHVLAEGKNVEIGQGASPVVVISGFVSLPFGGYEA